MHRMLIALLVMVLLNSRQAASQADLRVKPDSSNRFISLRILPQKFYTATLPYTCKKEIQLQQLTRLPIFIRLGSKEQTDYLEGKNHGWSFPPVKTGNTTVDLHPKTLTRNPEP